MSVEPADDPTTVHPTAASPPLFARQGGAIPKSKLFIGLGLAWMLVGLIAIAVCSQSRWRHPATLSTMTAPEPTVVSKQWSPGIVWKAPQAVDDAIKACTDRPCFFAVMQRYAAPPETVDFMQAELQTMGGDEEVGYPVEYHGTGRVKAVGIFYPGHGQAGIISWVFVNGPDGITRGKGDYNQELGVSPEFQAFKAKYPDAQPWDGDEYIKEVLTPDGGQQFQIGTAILNGCHACSRLGTLRTEYNFDATGSFKTTTLGVNPDKDAAYGAILDDLEQKSMLMQATSVTLADGTSVTAQAQIQLAAAYSTNFVFKRCSLSLSIYPSLSTDSFNYLQAFDVRDVRIERSNAVADGLQPSTNPPSALVIYCNNSTSCISPSFSDKRGAQPAVSSISFLVPGENVSAVTDDFEKLQAICGQN